MNQSAVRIHADVLLVAEVPLVALFDGMSFRITLLFFVDACPQLVADQAHRQLLLHLFIIPLSRHFGCSFFVRDCLKYWRTTRIGDLQGYEEYVQDTMLSH